MSASEFSTLVVLGLAGGFVGFVLLAVCITAIRIVQIISRECVVLLFLLATKGTGFVSAYRQRIHRTWWIWRHQPSFRFGSETEIAHHRNYLENRYEIEIVQGLDFEEEIHRCAREFVTRVKEERNRRQRAPAV